MKYIIIAATLLATTTAATAQFKKDKLYITATIAEHKDQKVFSSTTSENSIYKAIHPLITIGADYKMRDNKRWITFLGAELGYHNNNFIDKGIHIVINTEADLKINKTFYAGFGLGLGFQKAKRADIVYTLEDNIWTAQTYPGKWAFNRQFLRGNVMLGAHLPKIKTDVFIGSRYQIIRHWYGSVLPIGLQYTPIFIGARYNLK